MMLMFEVITLIILLYFLVVGILAFIMLSRSLEPQNSSDIITMFLFPLFLMTASGRARVRQLLNQDKD